MSKTQAPSRNPRRRTTPQRKTIPRGPRVRTTPRHKTTPQLKTTPQRKTTHCLICHRNIDSRKFKTAACSVDHWFDFGAPVMDIKAPSGFRRFVYFASCCNVAKTVTSDEAIDEPEMEEEDYAFHPGRGVNNLLRCYAGRHTANPARARCRRNGCTIVRCNVLGCGRHPSKSGSELAESYRERENAQHPIHKDWMMWAKQDQDLAQCNRQSLPSGVSEGTPAIDGMPYERGRVFRARDYLTRLRSVTQPA